MRFQIFIALRYLFSKKSNNVINWITRISAFVVLIVTAALIIIMSVMNGLSDSVEKLYSNFDPDLKIQLIKGKRFPTGKFPLEELRKIEGVKCVVESIEETVLLKYRDNQEVATVKGVTSDFDLLTNISRHTEGQNFYLQGGGRQFAVVGLEIAIKLGINPELSHNLGIFVPKLESTSSFGADFFNSIHPKPVDVFNLNGDFNSKYVLVSKPFVAELLGLKDEVDAVEVGIIEGADIESIKNSIQILVGEAYSVKTRFEQNEFLFKSISAEKWITLLILSLVVLLAIFNVVGSLTMLIIDKSKDIFVLRSLGATNKTIKSIFWMEGVLISLLGSLLGVAIGVLACFMQDYFCLVSFGSVTTECFPVQMKLWDIVIIVSIVNGVAFIGSLVPVRKITKF